MKIQTMLLAMTMTACGTDKNGDTDDVPLSKTSRAPSPQFVPNGDPSSGEVMPIPDGMKKFKSAETSCPDKCSIRLVVQSQCPTPSIVLIAWELRNKVFYSIKLRVDTSTWKIGDLVTLQSAGVPEFDPVDVEFLGYKDQSGVFYVCP